MQDPKCKILRKEHLRILYDPPPRILEIEAKINKWDLMKLKNISNSISNIRNG